MTATMARMAGIWYASTIRRGMSRVRSGVMLASRERARMVSLGSVVWDGCRVLGGGSLCWSRWVCWLERMRDVSCG